VAVARGSEARPRLLAHSRRSAGLGSTTTFAIHAHIIASALVAVIAVSAVRFFGVFADAGVTVAHSRQLTYPRGRAVLRSTFAFALDALVVVSARVAVIAASAVVFVFVNAFAVVALAHSGFVALIRGRAALGSTRFAHAVFTSVTDSTRIAVFARSTIVLLRIAAFPGVAIAHSSGVALISRARAVFEFA